MTDILVVLSLVGIAVGRFPAVRMNRSTIALVGATLIVLTGCISLEQAYAAVDLNTIVLLFAMMVFNANLRMAGFFQLVGHTLRRSARSPAVLLALLIAFSSVLSALFINDTLVMMLTPIVLDVALATGINPVPYLIGLAVSANVGSMATIIGNPQNILIGASSGLSFGDFSLALAPPALIILLLAYLLILLVFPREFRNIRFPLVAPGKVFIYKPLLLKSLASFLFMAAALIAGLPVSLAGLSGAALLLITRRIKPERVFADVDWSLLVLFPSLFVITRAAQDSWLFGHFYAWAVEAMSNSIPVLALLSASMSQLISNVPTVMLLRPLVPGMPDPRLGWLALSSATTLAGNLTLLGSVANLIVAELAARRKVQLGFSQYLKVGFPLTVLG
ncbi:MAG TPA: anion transporter, partial [Spirochaetaceae bacterium]|nr:anion transporter [Spirochaetaceae bacterium]